MSESDEHVQAVLEHAAARGEVRGAADVLTAARAQVSDPAPAVTRRRWLVPLAAVVTLVLGFGALLTLGSEVSSNFQKVSDNLPDDDDGRPEPTPPIVNLRLGLTEGTTPVVGLPGGSALLIWLGEPADPAIAASVARAWREVGRDVGVVGLVSGADPAATIEAMADAGLAPDIAEVDRAFLDALGFDPVLPGVSSVVDGAVERTLSGTVTAEQILGG